MPLLVQMVKNVPAPSRLGWCGIWTTRTYYTHVKWGSHRSHLHVWSLPSKVTSAASFLIATMISCVQDLDGPDSWPNLSASSREYVQWRGRVESGTDFCAPDFKEESSSIYLEQMFRNLQEKRIFFLNTWCKGSKISNQTICFEQRHAYYSEQKKSKRRIYQTTHGSYISEFTSGILLWAKTTAGLILQRWLIE